MSGKVFHCDERKIRTTKIIFTAVALIVPLAFGLMMQFLNVTFDNAIWLLASVLTALILFVTYYEGKATITALRRYRLEISSEHLIQVQGKKRELIFYKEIERVDVVEAQNGHVKRLKIVTPNHKTCIGGYESLEQLVEYLEGFKGIQISRKRLHSFFILF